MNVNQLERWNYYKNKRGPLNPEQVLEYFNLLQLQDDENDNTGAMDEEFIEEIREEVGGSYEANSGIEIVDVQPDELIIENLRSSDSSHDVNNFSNNFDLGRLSDSDELEQMETGSDISVHQNQSAQTYTSMLEKLTIKWSSAPVRNQRRSGAENVVHTVPGPKNKAANPNLDSLGLFSLFLDDEMVDLIVTRTNQRMQSRAEVTNKEWTDLDATEFRAFIGVLLLAGVLKSSKESVKEMWSCDLSISRPIFPATMSRDRFYELHRHITFDDVATRVERRLTDKLAPIREVSDMFVERFRRYYDPSPHLTVDEHLVPFRGNCPFRVYMKDKPDSYGIKVWAMADAENYYCCNFQVYLGKEGDQSEKGQGKRVVLDLTNHLANGYNITTDNFYTSIGLANALLERNHTLVGTMRKSKVIPDQLLEMENREVGSSMFCHTDRHTMVSYKAKKTKVVILLSTQHSNQAMQVVGAAVKPEILCYYNATKGGVDTMDEMLKTYRSNRKGPRYTMVLFCDLIDISALNAYVLHSWNRPDWNAARTDKRRVFLLELGKALIRPHILRRERVGLHRHQLTAIQTVLLDHGPALDPDANLDAQPEAKKQKGFTAPTTLQKPQRCHICDRSRDRKTKSICEICTRPTCSDHASVIYRCTDCVELSNVESFDKE